MSNPIVFMFAGQGSHYYHMGYDLYNESPVYRRHVNNGDIILKDELGISLSDILFDKQRKISDLFDNTIYTHPSLFVIQYALARTLIEVGIIPDIILGMSLGEIVAAAVSGLISWESGLHLTIKQGKSLQELCPKGGMVTILDSTNIYFNHIEINSNTSIACENFQGNFVISGSLPHIHTANNWLKHRGIGTYLLAISRGFHSYAIDPAYEEILNYQSKIKIYPSKLSYISCREKNKIKSFESDELWKAIREPNSFMETIKNLEFMGTYNYIDLSPSGTLGTFVKYNLPKPSLSKIFTILSPQTKKINIIGSIQKDIYENY